MLREALVVIINSLVYRLAWRNSHQPILKSGHYRRRPSLDTAVARSDTITFYLHANDSTAYNLRAFARALRGCAECFRPDGRGRFCRKRSSDISRWWRRERLEGNAVQS